MGRIGYRGNVAVEDISTVTVVCEPESRLSAIAESYMPCPLVAQGGFAVILRPRIEAGRVFEGDVPCERPLSCHCEESFGEGRRGNPFSFYRWLCVPFVLAHCLGRSLSLSPSRPLSLSRDKGKPVRSGKVNA